MSRPSARMLVVCAVLLVGGPVPAGAQDTSGSDVQTGVWWMLQAGGAGLPPPPLLVDIPEGGLWLSSGPGGDQARSAVRFATGDADPELLVLRIHQDSSTPALAFAVCAAAEPWSPSVSRPGPWEERAEPDCESFRADGEVDESREEVQFDLSDLEAGDTVDLVLTRRPDDTSSYLHATFAAPEASDLQVGSPVGAGGAVVPGPAGSAALPATAAPVASSPGFRSGGGTTFTPPVSTAPGMLPASPFDVGDGLAAAPAPAVVDVPATAPEAWDAARWVAAVALAVLMVWIAAILSRRMLGGAAAAGAPRFTLYRGAPPV